MHTDMSTTTIRFIMPMPIIALFIHNVFFSIHVTDIKYKEFKKANIIRKMET